MNVDKSEGNLEPTKTNWNPQGQTGTCLCVPPMAAWVPGLPVGEDGAFCCGVMLAHGPGLGEDEEEL